MASLIEVDVIKNPNTFRCCLNLSLRFYQDITIAEYIQLDMILNVSVLPKLTCCLLKHNVVKNGA